MKDSSYQKTILPNGLRIVSERVDHVRSVSMGVWIEVGSRDESPPVNGIFHFLEHMLFKGSHRRSARQIAESLESVGGALNGFTSREQTCYQARILDEHIPLALDVLSDLVLHPRLNPEDIEREKQVVRDEIRDLMDSPSDYIDERLASLVWRDNSIGLPISGTPDTIARFNSQELSAHLKSWYHPEKVVLAAAGNLDHDRLVKEVEKVFLFSKGSAAVGRRRGSFRDSGKVENIARDGMQLHLCVGGLAYSYVDPRKYPLLILNTALGEGMSSRLFQSLREQEGLAYTINSYLGLASDTGLIAIYLATEPGKGRQALQRLLLELGGLRRDGISQEELDHAKAQLKGHLMLGLESMSARMVRLAQQEILLETPVSLDETEVRIDAVTYTQVHEVAQEVLRPDRLSLVAIGPVSEKYFHIDDLKGQNL